MDKRILETILSDQVAELDYKRSRKFCYRQAEKEIDLTSPQAQVVIGVRRSGKSTLCFNALTRANIKFAYVNFDDERIISLKADELNDLLEVLYKINGPFNYLFIDEIQNIPEWYIFVNRLLRQGMHIVITGSNANLLSGELATHLTGRHNTITLYPFSFAEYCALKEVDTTSLSTEAIALRRAAFDDYILQGGFPELHLVKNERNYISSLVDNILKRDIEQRYHIQHTAAFEQLASHLLNIVPTILANKSYLDSFNLKSIHTVKNYIVYLKEAFLLSGLHKYSAKSQLRITREKIYPIDVALMNNRADAFAGVNLGWRLETIAYLELLRRYRSQGRDIYYYSDRSGECDFVICRNRQAEIAIQVSYDISNDKTRQRELNGLIHCAENTGAHTLLLLTDHIYDDITINNHQIAIRPLYEFALSPAPNE